MSVAMKTGGSRVVLEGGAAADLALVQHGVRLPWRRLGDRLGDSQPVGPDAAVAVAVSPDVLASVTEGHHVVLTDATLLPLAVLSELDLSEAASASTVRGQVESNSALAETDWLTTSSPVAVARRPLLDEELAEPLVVLVPASPSPEGVPAEVLRRAIEASAATRPHIQVVPVPVWWRDPASDRALISALADTLARKLAVFSEADPAWRSAARNSGRTAPRKDSTRKPPPFCCDGVPRGSAVVSSCSSRDSQGQASRASPRPSSTASSTTPPAR